MVFGGTYSFCLYLLFLSWYKKRRQKKIKASAEAEEVDRVHDWSWKRIDFLRSRVGVYCIRPTGQHPEDGEYAKHDTFLGYSFHRWNVCVAYAIRPYRVTGKRIAFLRYNDLIIWKRTTFWIFIFDEWWKRGSFSGYNNHIIRKRITFSGYIDLVV